MSKKRGLESSARQKLGQEAVSLFRPTIKCNWNSTHIQLISLHFTLYGLLFTKRNVHHVWTHFYCSLILSDLTLHLLIPLKPIITLITFSTQLNLFSLFLSEKLFLLFCFSLWLTLVFLFAFFLLGFLNFHSIYLSHNFWVNFLTR